MYLQVAVDRAIKAVCPIHGISFGKLNDKLTWKIHYKDEASDEEKATAEKLLAEFEWNDEKEAEAKLDMLVKDKENDPIYKMMFNMQKASNPDLTFKDFIKIANA